MKNIFLLLPLCMLLSNIAIGQFNWVGNFAAFYDSATDIIGTSKGQYIMVHKNGNAISVFDKEGNIVFKEILIDYSIADEGFNFTFLELSDSSFIFRVLSDGCYESSVENTLKFDKNWKRVPVSLPYGDLKARFSDNSMVFDRNGEIVKTDINGDLLWKHKIFGNSYLNDFVVTQHDTLIVATSTNLIKLTSNGDTVEIYPNIVFDHLAIMPNGYFLAQNRDTLYRLDSYFKILSKYEIEEEYVKDIDFDSANIVMLTSTDKLISLDLDLNVTSTVTLTGYNQFFYTLKLVEDGCLVGGSVHLGDYSAGLNSSAFLKKYSWEGMTVETEEDASLTNVAVKGGSNIADEFLTIRDIQLKLTNLGANIINSITVNMHWEHLYDYGCYQPIPREYSIFFDNLNLQPGASIQVVWDSLIIPLSSEESEFSQFMFCFWVSTPNHHLETNYDNNKSCTIVLMDEEEVAPFHPLHPFQAYFISSTNELRIDIGHDINQSNPEGFVFDANGQLVAAFPITEQLQSVLLKDLSNGVYFLQVVSKGWMEQGKFAKY